MTDKELEEGIREEFPGVFDGEVALLIELYREDPENATENCHGFSWLKKLKPKGEQI